MLKCGNIIQIYIVGTLKNINDGVSLATMPSEYAVPYRIMGFSSIGSRIEIRTTSILIRGNLTAISFDGNIIYLTES